MAWPTCSWLIDRAVKIKQATYLYRFALLLMSEVQLFGQNPGTLCGESEPDGMKTALGNYPTHLFFSKTFIGLLKIQTSFLWYKNSLVFGFCYFTFPIGIFPWETLVAFPEESKLRPSIPPGLTCATMWVRAGHTRQRQSDTNKSAHVQRTPMDKKANHFKYFKTHN